MDYQNLTDEVLVDFLCKSDEKAFEAIYHRYWSNVFRFAITRVHEQAIAEDLCHDIFLSLWQRRHVLTIRCLEAWLIQSVKYSVINHLKGQLTDKQYVQGLWSVKDGSDRQTEYAIEFNNLYLAWQTGIKNLPQRSKEIFQLSKIQHRSNKEIAYQLNLTEKAVEYHITKALKILRIHLKDFTPYGILILAAMSYFLS